MENNITRIKNIIQTKFEDKSNFFMETRSFDTDRLLGTDSAVTSYAHNFVEKLFKLDSLNNMLMQIDDALFSAEYVLDSDNEREDNLPCLRLKRLGNEVFIRCNRFVGDSFDVITSSNVYYANDEKEVLAILSLVFF